MLLRPRNSGLPAPITLQFLAVALILLLAPKSAVRCESYFARQQPSPDEILSATAENGSRLLSALRGYSYYADLTIETVGNADVITGKYYRLSQISFDSAGVMHERVIENTSTLPKDEQFGTSAADSLIRVYQFFLTRETPREYEFNYIGRERVDELNTFVFDVNPRVKLPDPEKSRDRYLKGRVWIDDQDFCVVKVAGQAVPSQSAHRTPKFQTYYQNHERYWFPALIDADDAIRIGKYVTRVVVKLRFTGYKKVGTQR